MKLLMILFWITTLLQAAALTVIPQPQSIKYNSDTFVLDEHTKIYQESLLSDQAVAYLQEHLQKSSDYRLKQSLSPSTLNFLVNRQLEDEAYELNITKKQISISAHTPSGYFYGVITLMQMMDAHIWSDQSDLKKNAYPLTGLFMSDAPAFKWRGMMLDSARNFFSVGYVKKFIDRMAQYKLNRFHWHLSDDEAWRIEIKKYPKLTTVGSVRGDDTLMPYSMFPTMKGKKQGKQEGFYTQKEIQDIVAYAKARSIEILPEIDLPAHAKAAIISYPELLYNPQDSSDYHSVQKVHNNTIDIGLKSTYIFTQNIIAELSQLFDFEYVHLGGDEIPKGAWSGSPSVQKLKETHHLKTTQELQAYFFSKLAQQLHQHQKKLITWQASYSTKIQAEGHIVMAWQSHKKALKALQEGQSVIFSPAPYLYFDQKQSHAKDALGHHWAGVVTKEKVYSYHHKLSSLSPQNRPLGIQGALWSEYADSEAKADYLSFPRLLILSELAWSKSKPQKYKHFQKRLQYHQQNQLLTQKINFCAD